MTKSKTHFVMEKCNLIAKFGIAEIRVPGNECETRQRRSSHYAIMNHDNMMRLVEDTRERWRR